MVLDGAAGAGSRKVTSAKNPRPSLRKSRSGACWLATKRLSAPSPSASKSSISVREIEAGREARRRLVGEDSQAVVDQDQVLGASVRHHHVQVLIAIQIAQPDGQAHLEVARKTRCRLVGEMARAVVDEEAIHPRGVRESQVQIAVAVHVAEVRGEGSVGEERETPGGLVAEEPGVVDEKAALAAVRHEHVRVAVAVHVARRESVARVHRRRQPGIRLVRERRELRLVQRDQGGEAGARKDDGDDERIDERGAQPRDPLILRQLEEQRNGCRASQLARGK